MTLVLRPDFDFLLPSVRQYQVLQELLKDGADNPTIALRLGIAPDTVKCHIKILLAKTGLANRTELAVAVLQGHLVVKIPAGGQ